MTHVRVLIVEDELIAAEFLKEILQKEGIDVIDIVDTGEEAIRTAVEKKPDIILMDIMLRDHISGSEAAVEISRRVDTEIIFLTAYSDPEMIDYAVESQAAGYLSKPYNETEIIATLRLALARKRKKTPLPDTDIPTPRQPTISLVDGYLFHTAHQRLLKEGEEVTLSPKARKLIALLCRQPDISISNEQIMLHIWGEYVNDKTLRSLIFRIRSATSENLIKNVSGSGYMIRSHI
jgi:DNA-binding response OmpR family regulator